MPRRRKIEIKASELECYETLVAELSKREEFADFDMASLRVWAYESYEQETVSAIEIPKELPPRLHNHRHIIGSEAKSIIIFFVTSIVMMIFMAIAVWNAYQPNVQRDDNDLKYRYMKMKGDASPAMMAELEDLFTLNRDASRIEAMRADVEEYEETILRQAAIAEQARLKAQEAEMLDNKAKSIKSK